MGRGRAPCCAKVGLNKGSWTPEEDMRLIAHIRKYGHSNWRALPKQAGLLRCGKSCRLRWINYLRPDLKRGNFTNEEEETIIQLHKSLGNKWSKIASSLPGRTDNEIKNVWNTHLKKKLTSKGATKETPASSSSSVTTNSVANNSDVIKNDNENTSKDMTNTSVDKSDIPMQPSDDLNLTDFTVTSPLIEPYWMDNNNIWEMDMDTIPWMASPCSSSLEEPQVTTNRIVSNQEISTCKDPLDIQGETMIEPDMYNLMELGGGVSGMDGYDHLCNISDDLFGWNPDLLKPNFDEGGELKEKSELDWSEHLERELGLWGGETHEENQENQIDPVSNYFQDEPNQPSFSQA
ncbi:hypothetical protein LUZ60_017015 [Juncus effusus]|nr:hypothetical protein LUZ60_017015 [Juncus effusus]